MDESKLKKIENAFNEIDKNNILSEEQFNEMWNFIEDYHDVKGKLTGSFEKKEWFNDVKKSILKVTNNNYKFACFISNIILGHIKNKGIDKVLNAIRKEELVFSEKEIKLYENIKDVMRIKQHDVEHMESLLSLLKNNNVTQANIKSTGFKSNLKPKEIESLFNQIKGKYIAENSNPEHFKAIFVDKTLPKDFNKVEWLLNKNLLAYFIDNLFFKTEQNLWIRAKNCFKDSDNLKQLKYLYEGNKSGKPKGFEQIDQILETIYTPLL